jgi:hypothetical protein
MNHQQLRKLLTVTQQNDYTWIAMLPELPIMWETGNSKDEAGENWLKEYDQPSFSPIFTSLLQKRAKHPQTTIEDTKTCKPIERPATVDFPYRGKLYCIATNEGLPKRHIVLPDGTILVVCGWIGRVPSALADIRRIPLSMAPKVAAEQLDGVLAEEISLLPGQTTQPMAILDFEGQRYAVNHCSHALVEFPGGRLYRIEATYPEEPVRIADIVPFDPDYHYMSYQLKNFGKTPAVPVPSSYPGVANEPHDLRIHFIVQGERFVLSHEAYEQKKWIVSVPNHGFYHVGIYLKSMPIQLGDLSLLPDGYYNPSDVATALRYADAVDIAPLG